MDLVIRATVVFFFILLVTRIAGRRELNTLEPFDDGEVIERNLRRERLSHGDLEEQPRRQQVGSIKDLRWAILEKDGSISVIPKS